MRPGILALFVFGIATGYVAGYVVGVKTTSDSYSQLIHEHVRRVQMDREEFAVELGKLKAEVETLIARCWL